jgi:uncharacterized membrane protein YqjE
MAPPDGTVAGSHSSTPSTFDSLKALGRTAVEALHSRLDLLSTELKEEQARITELLVVATLSLLCVFLAIVFAAFFVVVAVWDTPYRLVVTGLIAVALAAMAAALWAYFRREIAARPRPFKATLEELSADIKRMR